MVSSLPHRQLRKAASVECYAGISSLPHRQLRNAALSRFSITHCSLPHRQLRNMTGIVLTGPIKFTAA